MPPTDGLDDDRLSGHLGQRVGPESDRLAKGREISGHDPLLHEILEAERVDLHPGDHQPVPRRLAHQDRRRRRPLALGFEHPTQVRDVGVERGPLLLAVALPEQVGEAIGGDDAVGLDGEHGEHEPLAGSSEVDLATVVFEPQPAEHPQLHPD